MRNTLAIIIAISLVLSLTVAVSAEANSDNGGPEGYLWLKAAENEEAPGISFKVPGSLLADNDLTITAHARFGEDCVSFDGGCVFLNCYSYAADTFNDWNNLICFIDYAKDSFATIGDWDDYSIVINPYDNTYGRMSDAKIVPEMLALGIGVWNAYGTIEVSSITVEQNGAVIWSIDFSEVFDLTDTDCLNKVVAGALVNMTDVNKGTVWGQYIAAPEPASEESVEPEPAGPVNHAEGKTYVVENAEQRDDGWADDGVKLTNGVVGKDGSEEYSGFKSTAMSIIVDLVDVTEFNKISTDSTFGDWGINPLDSVEFAISDDGVEFTTVGEVVTNRAMEMGGFTGNWRGAEYKIRGNFSGRFVKITYNKTDDEAANHIWVSEIQVISTDEREVFEPYVDLTIDQDIEETSAESGAESTEAEASKPPVDGVPKTGDVKGLIALAVMGTLSLGTVAVMSVRSKKHTKKY